MRSEPRSEPTAQLAIITIITVITVITVTR